MPEIHAKLSPSAAERWFTCPGSVYLSKDMPSKSSEFSDEGTRAHTMAEAMLNGGPYEGDKDMQKHVLVYVNHVEDLCEPQCAVLHVEKQVRVNDDVWGTADAIVWRPDERTLYVRDLKYGAGVPVEVRGNLQLKIYALAALLEMKVPASVVNVGIVQPRLSHPDGPIRSLDFRSADLIDFHADLTDAVERVHAAHRGRKGQEWRDEYLHPSEKGCRWCLAAPTCPKLMEKAQGLAKQAFGPAASYDPNALGNTLDFLPILEGWIKNVREFAYSEAEQGRQIPGYKLVEKRATRKWRNEPDAVEKLRALGFDPWEYKVISPAAAEKLMGKKEAAVLEDLTVKESSGHTLVPEDDKRPAIRVDAKAAFGEA